MFYQEDKKSSLIGNTGQMLRQRQLGGYLGEELFSSAEALSGECACRVQGQWGG